jgi:hypothetical protein
LTLQLQWFLIIAFFPRNRSSILGYLNGYRKSIIFPSPVRNEGEGLDELKADPDEMEGIAGVKRESRDDEHAGLVIVQINEILAVGEP